MKIYLTAALASITAAALIASACAMRDSATRATPSHISLFH